MGPLIYRYRLIFLVVLLVIAVTGGATAYYNAIQATLQQAALTPINGAANLSVSANISQNIHVLCAKADETTFEEVFFNDPNVSQKLNFVNKRTIITFHGWISNTTKSWATDFKNNWVASNRSANMCLVDCSAYAYADYFTTASINSRLVANYFSGSYLPWMVTKGMSYSDLILSSHSMDGQILGQIGAALQNKIKFIIFDYDPADPLLPEILVSVEGAFDVEVIHTDLGEYGNTGD